MKQAIHKRQRCAIYTRKSIDNYAGEFGSLDAQRAICSAYIASQLPKGWEEISKRYDDLGESGKSLNRPALQELLRDVESGLVDVIVIYKLDRITRTIVDFVRLMDLLESCGVHFVSVTQNFDTADSTGRLIQNILLTFAQFEREMSGDRLRDKFRAMKERGMFVGGHPPFGFDLIEKKLVPNLSEANIVRNCFELYLVHKSLTKVAKILRDSGIRRRARISKRGRVVEGRGVCQAAVWNMLQNPVYVGDVRYKDKVFPGLHRPIVSRDLWEAVQKMRKQRTRAKVVEKHKSDLLRGLVFDIHGRSVGLFRDYRYNPSGTRYYRSNQNEWGRRNGVRMYRTKADDFEELILSAICARITKRDEFRALLLATGLTGFELSKTISDGPRIVRMLANLTPLQSQSAMRALIERIDISEEEVLVSLRLDQLLQFSRWNGEGLFRQATNSVSRTSATQVIAIQTSTVRIKRDLTNLYVQRRTPLPSRRNAYLVKLMRSARRAQSLVDDSPELSFTELATRCHCSNARLPRLLRLNYLAPDIVAAIFDGRQPSKLTGHELMSKDLPQDWSIQRKVLGFSEQQDTFQGAPGW